MNPIDAQAPTEVDAILAKNYTERARHEQKAESARHNRERAQKRLATATGSAQTREQTLIDQMTDTITHEFAAITELVNDAAPYEERYARDRWTRAFLVTSSNGHVHKSMNCPTCNMHTQYQWFTELSGKPEEQIVAMAGERACTTCYPSAPVDVLKRPTTLFSDEEKAKQTRSAERDRKRAEREAKKLIDPRTGRPVRDAYGETKTERGAELEATRGLQDLLWYGPDHPSADQWVAVARRVAFAKAAKHGTSPITEFDSLRAKAAKRHKTTARRHPELLARTLDDVDYQEPPTEDH